MQHSSKRTMDMRNFFLPSKRVLRGVSQVIEVLAKRGKVLEEPNSC